LNDIEDGNKLTGVNGTWLALQWTDGF